MTFEESIKRLEEILEIVEKGEISLDEINKLFEEGTELSKNCFEMLDKSKGKITVLRAELEKLVEKPFN